MPHNLLLRLLLLTGLGLPLAACGTKGNLYRSEEPAASMDRAPQQLILAHAMASLPPGDGADGAPVVAMSGDFARRRVGA
jgi:predicted small lipoprotein YifL